MNPIEGKGARRQGAEQASLTEALQPRILDSQGSMETMNSADQLLETKKKGKIIQSGIKWFSNMFEVEVDPNDQFCLFLSKYGPQQSDAFEGLILS